MQQALSTNVETLEEQTFTEDDSFEVPPPDVIAYNELRSCADLYRLAREGLLEIHSDFQREIVWNKPAQTRFIDSLVKQLPIPSMCFSFDYKTERWQVIDGLQRMSTIVRFLSGDKWTLSAVPDIDPSIAGTHVPDFLPTTPGDNLELHKYYRRIENFTLPITVIRCDSSNPKHMEYVFTIFHRLNTGSTKLNNQEIRNCIYSGAFNDLLVELDQNEIWLKLNGRSSTDGDRYRGRELILRLFAFQDCYQHYKGRLAAFLNEYMQAWRQPDSEFLAAKKELFDRTVRIVGLSIFKGRPHGNVRLSVLEATLVGVACNLDWLQGQADNVIRQMYYDLLKADEFSDEILSEGLSGIPRVQGRMSTAKRIFSGRRDDK